MAPSGRRRSAAAAVLSAVVAGLVAPAAAPAFAATGGELLPDLQTVVPLHLGIQNKQQREVLRFSNGIANTGEGDLRLRPDPPVDQATTVTNAVQEVLASDGSVVRERVVSTYEFHPAHNHWHIGDVALFEVLLAADDGTGGAFGPPLHNSDGAATSVKVTFCLIDWYRLEGNSPTKARTYFDCKASHQGISPGWVDQYHQATDGQQIDITGAPAGVYYLVSTANPLCAFEETDCANNQAWTGFRLERASNGNPKVEVVGRSPCATPALCGEGAPNR